MRRGKSARIFPPHVVCAWLGNTEDVAREHCLMVTDEHFERAGADSSDSKAQRSGASQRRLGSHSATRNPENLERNANPLRSRTAKTDAEGFEPPVSFHPRRFSRPVP